MSERQRARRAEQLLALDTKAVPKGASETVRGPRGEDPGSRLKRWKLIVLAVVAAAAVAGTGYLGIRAKSEAHTLITNPIETRHLPGRTPEDYSVPFENVGVITADGLSLVGWYVPSRNGAAVIAQHGYKADRGEMLNEAAMLHQHGFGVLLSTIRAHDLSEGHLITFGRDEVKDLAAWWRFLRSRPDVQPDRIGFLGNSFGGTLGIQFAAGEPGVAAVVTNSAFSSLEDTIDTSVRFFTGLPPFPFASLIRYFAEREAGFSASEVDAKRWIARLSPRPVLLMQGGADVVISKSSGDRLFEAARDPKELWFEPEVGHSGFDEAFPEEYEKRVVAFFRKYLLRPTHGA